MDRQQVFDRVVTHLLAQNKRCVEGNDAESFIGSCRYRQRDGNNTLKCAIGALIDDAHYSANLENKTPRDLVVTKALIASGVDVHFVAFRHLGDDEPQAVSEDVTFLMELQRVHDSHKPAAWRSRFAQIAREWRLNTDVIDNFKGEVTR